MTVRETQVWFGPTDSPLFGWLSRPVDDRVRAGIVLVPPLAHELFSTHRLYRRLAEALTARGCAVLRFDLAGTGDSAGDGRGPGRVAAWRRSVADARGLLVDLGAPRTALVGVRFGATLAAFDAYDAAGAVDSLVLWDPCRSGRAFLREGNALLAMTKRSTSQSASESDLRYGAVPGYQFDEDTIIDMEALDLKALPTDRPLARRVLHVVRPDRPAAAAVDARLEVEGDRLTVMEGGGEHSMLSVDLNLNTVPVATMHDIVTWLVPEGDAAEPAVLTNVPAEGGALVEGRVRESVVRIGPRGLVGVQAVSDGAAPDAPWVVMLNAARQHHIGPGRLWVEMGRRFASTGYRCLRLDLSSTGDSPSVPGGTDDLVNAPEWIDDARCVVRHLQQDGVPVILVGQCSGSYNWLEASMWERTDALIALNPGITLIRATRGTPLYSPDRRAAVVVPIKAPQATGARRRRLERAWAAYRQLAVWSAPFLVLRRVVRRGTLVWVVGCADDVDEFSRIPVWRPSLRRLVASGRLRIDRQPTMDHNIDTLTSAAYVREALPRMVDDFARRLAR